MCVEQRVRICRLLEKMKEQEAYSRKIGIENLSTFRGKKMSYDRKLLVARA